MKLPKSTWKRLQAQGKDVVFLGIDFQESSSDATSYLQQYGITYPAVLDANGSVAIKYGVTSLPQTIFINRNGTVTNREPRELSAQVLSSDIQSIL